MPNDGFSYPEPGLLKRFALNVGDGHVLNVETSGTPGGCAFIDCHGGPGGQIGVDTRRYGDPGKAFLIQFDQRGCGRSQPAGATDHNTLQYTIADMERLRETLEIDNWVVVGGSWGATVALAYAQAHPQRTKGVIVRGAFLGDERGFRWFDDTMREIFPDAFEEFAQATGAAPTESIYGATERRIGTGDRKAAERAALALTIYEERCASLSPPPDLPDFDAAACLSGIEVALHYRRHTGFLQNGVLPHMHKIAQKPGIIVHGRYDIICPFGNAVRLKQHWPAATLALCDFAGHLGSEPQIAAAMTRAFEEALQW